MKIRITIETPQPTPFLFFAPDTPPHNGFYLDALARAQSLLGLSDVLLAVDPVHFNHLGHLAKVSWNEFYNSAYCRTDHEVERLYMLLKQLTFQKYELKGNATAEKILAEAIAEGKQEIEEVERKVAAQEEVVVVEEPVAKPIKKIHKKQPKKTKGRKGTR